GRLFAGRSAATPAEAMQAALGALRVTRGAAVAIVALDRAAGRLRFAGVGNIAGSIVPAAEGARSQSVVSHNGIVGHQMRKVQEFDYAWPEGALLVLHSDGLATQWRLDERPGLARRDAALVAGVLYRDWTRGRDDVTVVVARHAARPDAAA
ncbi:SpoIIE family protein phosphatase, partial [Roseisolibacter sp. H3M3-2]|uniref:SpoIIE family protein phosphatase n=1 Tax=Roseisolibacter sp. H3M3-2 TaxID=3031323 RepID=UPI0023DC828D